MVSEKYDLLSPQMQNTIKRNSGPLRAPPKIHKLWIDHPEEVENIILHENGNRIYKNKAKGRKLFEPEGSWALYEDDYNCIYNYLKQAYAFRRGLMSLTDEKFKLEYSAYFKRAKNAADLIALKDDDIAFFSFPEADADLQVWRTLPAWSIEEATALSFQKDPAIVNLDSLASYTDTVSLFARAYRFRSKMISRAVQVGELYEPLRPDKFINWCKLNSIDAFSSVATQIVGQSVKENTSEYTSRTSTLYKMIIGMAICRYSHRTGQNSLATKQIEEDLRDIQMESDSYQFSEEMDNKIEICLKGFDISNATIRKVLFEGCEELQVKWPNAREWRGHRVKYEKQK